MKRKSKSSVTREELQNYRKFIVTEGRDVFFPKFFEVLNNELTSYFSPEEAVKVLKLIKRGAIRVKNIEYFFSTRGIPYDPSEAIATSSRSLHTFIRRFLFQCEEFIKAETTSLNICYFFLFLARALTGLKVKISTRNTSDVLLRGLLDPVACFFSTKTGDNPVTIQVLGSKAFVEAKETLGIDVTHEYYLLVVGTFLEALEDLKKTEKGIKLPKIELLTGVEAGVTPNILSYLSHTYGVKISQVKKAIKDVRSFKRYTPKVQVALEKLYDLGQPSYIDNYEVFLNLKQIREDKVLKNFRDSKEYFQSIDNVMKRGLLGESDTTEHLFIPEGAIIDYIKPALCEIVIDCSKYEDFEDLEVLIGAARALCFIKSKMNKLSKKAPKIILYGSHNYTEEFLSKVKETVRKIKSYYRRQIDLVPCFKKDSATAFFGTTLPTHIRVISDMHVDHPYNQNKGYYFNFGNDFVLNCGDTSSEALTTVDWVKGHMPNGLVIAGNHLGYKHPFIYKNNVKETYNNTLVGQVKYLASALQDSTGGAPLFLHNNTYEYNGVVFIGSPLYTNFKLFGEKHIEECKGVAKNSINDYRYVTTVDSWSLVDWRKPSRLLTPKDHEDMFNTSYNYILGELEKHKGKPIVVMTHFAPSSHSLDPRYKGSALDAFFASNCSELLEKYKVRLWCHGHVHQKVDYIYKGTRIVACPFGYGNENNADLPYNYGLRISFKDLKSKKKWENILNGEVKVFD